LSKERELTAHAAVNHDGAALSGKIPAPVVKALKAKAGDVLAFGRRADGAVIVRKWTPAERKSLVKSPVSKKGAGK